MSDTTRIAVVLGVLALAAVIGWMARRSSGPQRVIGPEHGPFPAVIFFGSESCQSCRPAWDAVVEAELEVRNYTWEHDAEVFEAWEIEEVPLLWVLDRRGRVRREISGVPEVRALRRLKLQVARE